MSNILEVPQQHAIQALIAKRWSLRHIARTLGINRRTVKRYAAGTAPKCTTEVTTGSGPPDKGKRQNQLTKEHIKKIIDTYKHRTEAPRYSRRVEMDEIQKNDFNLNISRYISTAVGEAKIDLKATHGELVEIEKKIKSATDRHNRFLKELKLPPLP